MNESEPIMELTLNIPPDILLDAKAIAAMKRISFSQYISDMIIDRVNIANAYYDRR
ncbi:MAG: hypothetical protein ISN29_07455 [Gammaproteobacteria bacterium AqS3]|nr:hypothetical protein [Gammaproteobacteria bacterium AqS3]